MFTLIRAVLLKPLEFPEPDRLVRVSVDSERLNVKDVGFSETRFENLTAAAKSFSGLAPTFFAHEDMTLSVNGDPESIKAGRVSHNFLSSLESNRSLEEAFFPKKTRRAAGGL